MKVYKDNIVRLKEFYGSNYFKYLRDNDPTYIDKIINAVCIDPDKYDIDLYCELATKYKMKQKRCNIFDIVNNQEIKMSSDFICGLKQIRIAHPNFEDWINDYNNVRANIGLHFAWPQHELPTINTYRYTIYRDRIDYLLYDLKCYFEGMITPMEKAYQNGNTALWLKQFANNFPDFVTKMHFDAFVNENYEILDIQYNQDKIINYTFAELKNNSKDKGALKCYLEQLLQLNKNKKI